MYKYKYKYRCVEEEEKNTEYDFGTLGDDELKNAFDRVGIEYVDEILDFIGEKKDDN